MGDELQRQALWLGWDFWRQKESGEKIVDMNNMSEDTQ